MAAAAARVSVRTAGYAVGLMLFTACALFDRGDPAPSFAPGSGPIDYVALGDSIAAGTGEQPYPARFAELLERDTGTRVRLTNLAVGGWTTGRLLSALRRDARMRGALARAHVVTWNIGGNDFLGPVRMLQTGRCGGVDGLDCLRRAIARFERNWVEIVEAVRELAPRGALLRTLNVYNPFAGWYRQGGPERRLRPYADQVTSFMCSTAEERGVACADVYRAFNGPDGGADPTERALIAPDGIHPSARGQELIASTLRELGYEPLAA